MALTLATSISSFASFDLDMMAAKNILLGDQKTNYLEGLVSVSDSNSENCVAQIYSNYEGEISLLITNSRLSQNMSIDSEDINAELIFDDKLMILSNSRFVAKIHLVDKTVTKVEMKPIEGFFSFMKPKYHCEF